MKPAVSPLLDEAFGDALAAETLRNARLLNRIRLGVLSAFLLLHLVLGAALGQPAWRAALGGIALYWIAALGIFLGSRKSGRLARLSGIVVGFLDTPMVFFIQAGSLGSATDERAAGTFTTVVFLFLIMLAALSLRTPQIWIAAGVGIAAEVALQVLAGETAGGMIASVMLLSSGASLCAFALKRRIELMR